jgi:hypothetical protein
MPTGYTSDLHDGKDITFPEFAAKCAHAFGALILFRDSPASTTLPEIVPEEDDYHARKLQEAHDLLAEIGSWSPDEIRTRRDAAFARTHAAWVDGKARDKEMRARYEGMLAEVNAWSSPSPKHDKFKEFMVEQIESSIKFDCGGYEPGGYFAAEPQRPLIDEWLQAQEAKATRDMDYHFKEGEADRARQAGRREWVETLRASLEPVRA